MNIERATATHGAGLNWSQVRRGETLRMQVMLLFQVDFLSILMVERNIGSKRQQQVRLFVRSVHARQGSSGWTALQRAASEGHTMMCKVLMRHPEINLNYMSSGTCKSVCTNSYWHCKDLE